MAKWRNSIEIKKYFTKDESDQSVYNVVEKLIPQLRLIINSEYRNLEKMKEGVKKDNLEYELNELEGVTQEFEWIRDGIETKEDITELYDSWLSAFNEYLNQLYDIGDSIIEYKDHFNQEKFLWIG